MEWNQLLTEERKKSKKWLIYKMEAVQQFGLSFSKIAICDQDLKYGPEFVFVNVASTS